MLSDKKPFVFLDSGRIYTVICSRFSRTLQNKDLIALVNELSKHLPETARKLCKL
jgi:hypothetical protein